MKFVKAKYMGNKTVRYETENGELFAVFPSYEIGENALRVLLKTKKYQERDLGELVKAYAPKEDGNDPDNYKKLVKQFTGLDSDKKLKELNSEELEKVIKAIIRVEGNVVGEIIPLKLKKIIQVSEEKGAIISYLIEEYGWVDRAKAVIFAREGVIDAVIVEGKNGEFLRSRPDETTSAARTGQGMRLFKLSLIVIYQYLS
jgi:hypothetical protein